jgi:hypothetical protein
VAAQAVSFGIGVIESSAKRSTLLDPMSPTAQASGVFVEDWGAGYGSPMLMDNDPPPDGLVEIAEPDPGGFAVTPPTPSGPMKLAFVDGVRRGDAIVYSHTAAGQLVRGIAGTYAVGAVLCDGTQRPRIEHASVERLLVWSAGHHDTLPDVPGGWSWRPVSTHNSDPDAALNELQDRMRHAEARVAELLAADGWTVVADGPLHNIRSRDLPVCGYVKTHHRQLLPDLEHERVAHLAGGQRTPLFRLGRDRYSCYLRLCERGPRSGPWHGITRLEVPQSAGLADAVALTDQVAARLCTFAGVAHCDPRAPQNLQPIGGLERHLRHLLGDGGLAARAIRQAAA